MRRAGEWRSAPLMVLAAACVAAAVVLLAYADGLTWFQDSWEFLMHRREPSLSAWLDPHNEHIVLIPVLLFQGLLHVFGMSSMVPEQVLLTLLLAATAIVVFVYARRRVGAWGALVPTVILLFLGPSWQDLLWPFQTGFAGSALTGVGSLLALEREDRRGDAIAAGLLVLSVGFSSLGLPFAAAAAVAILLRGRERGLGRLWVVAAPALLYLVWWLGWGHTAETHVTAHNVLVSPRYLWNGFEASVDSVLGLATIFSEPVGLSDWALPVMIVGLLAVAYGRFRGRRFSPGLWPPLAAAVVFWLLAGFNSIPGREAWSSRYLYIGALFLILIVVNLLDGLRLRRHWIAVAAVLTGAVVVLNLVPLREGRDFFREQSVLTRADLGAIEIAAATVQPGFALLPELAGTPYLGEVTAGEYLQAADEFGSPAYTPAQLAAAPEAGRRQADIVLANALPLSIETEAAPPSAAEASACRELGEGAPPLRLKPGRTTTVVLSGEAPGAIELRRFAVGEFPLNAEGLAPGSTVRLEVPRDRAPEQPWLLQVDPAAGARVC